MMFKPISFGHPKKLVRAPNTKFPGVAKFIELLREMSVEKIAETLDVTTHTVTKWVKIHELGHLLPSTTGFHKSYHNALAYRWAKVKLSNLEGINGWFRKMPI